MNHRRYCSKIAADRNWWLGDAGAHYRELATWLRDSRPEMPSNDPQRELLDLGVREKSRAETVLMAFCFKPSPI
jgi:hypothetical protein